MRTIVHVITGLGDGGAENVLFNLCKYDSQDQHEVISLGSTGKYGPLLGKLGIPVTCLNMPRGRVTVAGLYCLWRILRSTRAEVIQTWMYHANLLGGVIGHLAGKRNISWSIHHSDPRLIGTSKRTVIVAWLCALLSRWIPRTIICCAHRSAQNHDAFGYDARRIKVIQNGYDLSALYPDDAARANLRNALNLDLYQPVIGFVASYNPLKDHRNLLDSLVILGKQGLAPTCLLVGTGIETKNKDLMADIERLDLGNQIRLMGQRNDIPAVMNSLDLHVMSSVSEAFPNVLAEAMACGTPCVATDVGDVAEILGETGWIVPVRNPKALSEAIQAAMGAIATSGWKERKRDARLRIEAYFSIQHMVDGYRSVWFGEPPDKVSVSVE